MDVDVMSDELMKSGVVRWFDKDKGYGFISYNDKDFFVHHKDIVADGYRMLVAGQRVKFVPSVNEKGSKASQVTVA